MKEDNKTEEVRGTRGAMQICEEVDVNIWCLFFVSARTNKRHHHHKNGSLGHGYPRTRSGEANDRARYYGLTYRIG